MLIWSILFQAPQGAYCLSSWRTATVLVVCYSNLPLSSRTYCKHLLLESVREFTRQPHPFPGCSQQMAEHDGSARAGPFLPSVGLLCREALGLCKAWTGPSQSCTPVQASSYPITLPFLSPFLGIRPISQPEDSPCLLFSLSPYLSQEFLPRNLLHFFLDACFLEDLN